MAIVEWMATVTAVDVQPTWQLADNPVPASLHGIPVKAPELLEVK